MPNWVSHSATVSGDPVLIQDLIDNHFIKTEEGELALVLNSIVPMPQELNIESSSAHEVVADYIEGKAAADDGVKKLHEFKGLAEEAFESVATFIEAVRASGSDHAKASVQNAHQRIQNRTNHGHADWYSWCVSNWGTKWDTTNQRGDYESGEESFGFSFDTAWGSPEPALRALQRKYPKLGFEIAYYDEGAFFAGVAESVEVEGEVNELVFFEKKIGEVLEEHFGTSFEEVFGCPEEDDEDEAPATKQ